MSAGMPAPETGAAAGPDAARARLVEQLRASGRVSSDAVQSAFLAVPRHLFLPEMPSEAAYQDEAFVIKSGADGVPLSSSSQPAIMAIMLEQLGLERGHRVLEIGTGTGYNAALMAQIVGDPRNVISVDIDGQIVERARSALAAAGYGGVQVSCGDGGFGVPERAPYDRIIVTAGAWNLALDWLAQLGPGGRIVLPLSVRGIQLSVAFETVADYWASTSACRCGFIRMAGALAGPETLVPFGAPGWFVQADDGKALDTRGLYAALNGPATDVAADAAVPGMHALSDADLWLTLTEPRLTRLTLLDPGSGRSGRSALMPYGGLTNARPGVPRADLAAAALVATARTPAEAAADTGVVVRGYGPGGGALAGHLADQIRAWDGLGRPGAAGLSLRAFLSGAELVVSAGQIILDRGSVRLAVGWPVR
ncbi:MAG: methyltransferase, FxLD system [Streptosporangiaceae bacterium]